MNIKYHHIGIAVKDIAASLLPYQVLGYEASAVIDDPVQNVRICFLRKDNSPTVELVMPKDECSPVYGILQKNGVMPYHICYEVENMQEAIAYFRKERFLVVKEPAVAVAIGNRHVCFLYNKNCGLIELVSE